MNTNELTIITPKFLLERMDRIEFKLDQLLSNKDNGTKLINGEEYVNEARAAEMLNIARSTLSSWKSRGLIPFHKPEWSNKSFFKIKDIMATQNGVKHSSNKEIKIEAKTYLRDNRKKKIV